MKNGTSLPSPYVTLAVHRSTTYAIERHRREKKTTIMQQFDRNVTIDRIKVFPNECEFTAFCIPPKKRTLCKSID